MTVRTALFQGQKLLEEARIDSPRLTAEVLLMHATGHDRAWLYAHGIDLPDFIWGDCEQRIPQWMIDRYGYEKARRIGVVAMVGGKDKTKIRNATPREFRDVLVAMARTAKRENT